MSGPRVDGIIHGGGDFPGIILAGSKSPHLSPSSEESPMATVTHVDHFALSDRIEERLRRGALTSRQVEDFKDFLAEVDRDLLHHRIITDNAYTRWFSLGEAT